MNYKEFLKKFPDDKSAIDYFVSIRFPEGVTCPKCHEKEVKQRKENLKFYHCRFCNYSFSVFKDTIFEKTTTDLQKWFYAIHLFLNAKKGISAKQLQREIGVTYKTAWRILHQIRKAMAEENPQGFYEAIIEIDETYVGGKPRKGNNKDDDNLPKNKPGRGTNKTPVIGIVSRTDKKVYAKVCLPNRKGKKLTGLQILMIFDKIVKSQKNIVITDEFRSYKWLTKLTNIVHFQIDHRFSYADGDIHTNTIESFWAIVKRSVYGIYHRISVKYLQAYINEMTFRWNHREIDSSFDLVLRNAIIS
jgi:transposase-like protein